MDVSEPLWNDDAEFSQHAANLIALCRAGLDQSFPCPMHSEYRLLRGRLDRYVSHVRPGYCFADRLRIPRIVLVRLQVGFTNCGAIKFTVWPKSFSLRARWCALPHASIPIRQGSSLAKYSAICAPSQPPAHHDLAIPIHAADVKEFLCQINANRRNLHGGRSFPDQ